VITPDRWPSDLQSWICEEIQPKVLKANAKKLLRI
jgi:hypothetical protein